MLMNKSIAQEVAPYRIRVNSVCPGAIRTPINRSAWETPAAHDKLMELIPYKRSGPWATDPRSKHSSNGRRNVPSCFILGSIITRDLTLEAVPLTDAMEKPL